MLASGEAIGHLRPRLIPRYVCEKIVNSLQPLPVLNLTERAIYQLPNGRELVARVTHGDRVVLYNLSSQVPGQYEFNSEDRLLFHGELTAWEMKDLHETGRVASPDLIAHLAAGSLSDRDTHEQSPGPPTGV